MILVDRHFIEQVGNLSDKGKYTILALNESSELRSDKLSTRGQLRFIFQMKKRMTSHLKQSEYRIAEEYEMRIRTIAHVAFRCQLLFDDPSARHRRRVAAPKEVRDVGRRALKSVLQAEGVDDHVGVMEVELSNKSSVFDNPIENAMRDCITVGKRRNLLAT